MLLVYTNILCYALQYYLLNVNYVFDFKNTDLEIHKWANGKPTQCLCGIICAIKKAAELKWSNRLRFEQNLP